MALEPTVVWLFAALGSLAAYLIWLFNRLIRDRNQVRAAWSDVDVQLQRRHDLVPSLVESVRAYAKHESSLLERLVDERNRARSATTVKDKSTVEQQLDKDLDHLIAIAESYPDLKASANFAQLAQELVNVEDHLQYARRFYNGSVRQFNTRIQQLPDVLVARTMGFQEADFFAAQSDARRPIEVELT